jgi:hypothetical protein
MEPEVNKEDFVAIVNNQAPGSGERLTARNNTTRTRVVWKLDEVTQTKVPVECRLQLNRDRKEPGVHAVTTWIDADSEGDHPVYFPSC